MRALLLALSLALVSPVANAQDTAALVADSVRIEAESRLIAEGGVQVAYQGTILTATRVIYDRAADQLSIVGPISLNDGAGAVIVADSAQLDGDLRNGILESARLVLDRQLQLAAGRIARVDGRYTQLANTVVSACEICADNPTPTWEIRARRVIHDNQENLIYFDNATFRLFGVPIAYFPKLRLPDSTRKRATGILIPRIASNTQLGFGIKQPIFFALGPHADVTLTPYISSETTTLEARYRQTFRRGAVNISGAFSRDTLLPDELRYYLIGSAGVVMPYGFRLEVDVQSVSDDSYLVDYDYAGLDRLQTEARLIRADRDLLIRGSLTGYETLRGDEFAIRDELPSLISEFVAERRIPLRFGELRLEASAGTIYRESGVPGVPGSAIPAQRVGGRDVAEVGLAAELFNRQIADSGLVWTNRARISGQIFDTVDTTEDFDTGRVTGTVSTELRLPLQRTTTTAHHVIEPVVQLAYTDTSGRDVPNEDSLLVEFDEGNLLALSRFPGDDVVEQGFRGNAALNYTTLASDGTGISLTFGRIFRADDDTQFTPAAGLRGLSSDWLASGQLSMGQTFDVTARAIFDDTDFSTRKGEARSWYSDNRFGFNGSYVFLEAEPLENRPDDLHELIVDTDVRLSRHWIGSFASRYDLVTDSTAEAALGLTYRTECIEVDFNVARRFTETATIEPSTSFGFSFSLAGFGTDRYDDTYRKTCKG